MKQKYYSMAPDISAGGTTINDVGKQTYSRKRFNLWSFLLCLMAMMLPVGAWGQTGSGTETDPWTGNIGYKTYSGSEKAVYLNGVTGGQLHIQTDGVTIYVAGNNKLTATNSHPGLELGSSKNYTTNQLTIKHWSSTPSSFIIEAKDGTSIDPLYNPNPKSGIDFHDYQTTFTIDGPVIVSAKPKDATYNNNKATAIYIATNSNIILKNGAYLTYSNQYASSTVPSADKWSIENFASTGNVAANISISNTTTMSINPTVQSGTLKTTNVDGTTFYVGQIGEQTFVAPSSNSTIKLQVANTLQNAYGEVFTTTDGTNYPFPIRTDNTAGSILSSVNVGAAVASNTYYGQLNGQTSGDFNLNVTKYPHSGTLSASNGNITLNGTNNYKTLNTVSDGFSLSATNNHTLTLSNITIPAGNTVYVSGDVRLTDNCTIANEVTKFQRAGGNTPIPVYYYTADVSKPNISDLKDNWKVTTNANYPNLPVTLDKGTLHMWLPAVEIGVLQFKITNQNDKDEIYVIDTNTPLDPIHNTKLTISVPKVKIVHTTGAAATPYSTIAEAFSNVLDGETVQLDANYTWDTGTSQASPTDNIKEGQSFTLDLNGHALTINNTPLISGGKGKLILTTTQNGGSISGDYKIGGEGGFYTDLTTNIGNPHVEGIQVYRTSVSGLDNITGVIEPVSYKVGDTEVYAAKHESESTYCFWLPNGTATNYIKHEGYTVAQLANGTSITVHGGSATITPIFDIASGSIKVESDKVSFGGIISGSTYRYSVNQTSSVGSRANIISTAADFVTGNQIEVDGAHVTLDNIKVQSGQNQNTAPLTVKGTSSIKIVGTNALTGLGTQPAISLEGNANLTLTQDQTGFNDAGYLDVKSSSETAAISGASATLTFDGGTLWAHRNSGLSNATPEDAIDVQTATYKMGSVYVKFNKKTRFQTNTQANLYLLTIRLEKTGPYKVGEADNYVYASPNNRVYLWLQANTNGEVTLTNQNGTSPEIIPHTDINMNDENSAPAAIVLKGVNNGGQEADLGAFLDLTDISEEIQKQLKNYDSFHVLSQVELTQSGGGLTVYGKPVTLDLCGHNISGKPAVTLTANTDWLTVVNGGYLKEDFNIEGEKVFIDKSVNLTQEARFKKNGQVVTRVLLSGLPVGENSYQYTHGSNSGTFQVREDGTACLWVPATSTTSELIIKIGNIEYTAGQMMTELHKIDYINVTAKDVVAQVIPSGQTSGTYYKTLADALNAVKNLPEATVKLWANISTPTVEASGQFTIDLNGYRLSNQANSSIQIKDASSRITIDNLSTSEGSRAELSDLSIILSDAGNQLHVTEKVNMADNCKVKIKDNNGTELWRTWFYSGAGLTRINYDDLEYNIIKYNIACLWLPKAISQSYNIKINDATTPTQITAIITASHYNEMRVGQQDEAEIVGTENRGMLTTMFEQAQSGQTIKLLKPVEISTNITLDQKDLFAILNLDRHSLSANGAKIILTTCGLIVTAENYNRANLLAPVQIGEQGLLYIRSTLEASKIGEVTNEDDVQLYRLSVTGIPTVTQGKYSYTYRGTEYTGYFFNRVTGSEPSEACFWLPEGEVINLKYAENVTGTPDQDITDKITIIAKHNNQFILGTSGVAEIVGGATYNSLDQAIQALSGSTGTIRLLQNITVSNPITANGTIEIDMNDKTIMGSNTASITVPAGSNLHIMGEGEIINVNFTAEAATVGGNANLSVDRSVDMNDACIVKVNNAQEGASDANRYRLIVDGMTPNTKIDIFYGGSTGRMTTDANGALCIWSQASGMGDDQNSFTLQSQDGQTWTAQGVAIAKNHANYIKVSATDLVASVKEANGTTDHECTTLEEAFRIAGMASTVSSGNHGTEILLRRNLTELTGSFKPACTDQNITFNLNGMNIASDNARFASNDQNILILKNGTLTGDITIPVALEDESAANASIFADKTLNMDKVTVHGTLDNNTVTLWRTLITLPKGSSADKISYSVPGKDKAITGSSACIVDNVACVWFTASNTTLDVTFTVNDTDYEVKNLIITASHGNEIDLNDLSPVASIENVEYASLAAALAKVQDGKTITLLKDLVLSTSQTLGTVNATLDLNGKNLSFTSGGFNVAADKTLTITDNTITGVKGVLTGVIQLTGEGNVSVAPAVTIGGVVMKKTTADATQLSTVYRLIVEGAAPLNVWVETPERNTDVQYGTDPSYEYTIPAGLANHQTKVKGYKMVIIEGDENIDAVKDCNVVVKKDVTWKAIGKGNIHRLTIHEKGKVEADGAEIIATDGIRYVRSFTSDKWSLIALPYTATDITTVDANNKVVSLSPAANPGTAGHFWLQTIKNDGSTAYVTSGEMTANQVYIMAVPVGLNNQNITFISGPNQMLYRDKVLNPNPISGFVAYANGTLDEVTLTKQFYKLNDGGDKFERVDEPGKEKISPFSGYLLADEATTKTVAFFALRSTPTANEEIEVADDKLQIRTQPGRIILTADEPMQVIICDMAGVVKFYGEIPAGDSSYEVGAGAHIVNTQKVIVQ
ncbi:hypothetical protein [Parabacteroides sp.]